MEHVCNICNKKYASYQSLWNHNRKYHDIVSNQKVTIGLSESNQKVTMESSENNYNKLACKYCNKIFRYKQGKWRHEQNCQEKQNYKDIKLELIEINNKINKLEKKSNNKPITNIKVHGNMINGTKLTTNIGIEGRYIPDIDIINNSIINRRHINKKIIR